MKLYDMKATRDAVKPRRVALPRLVVLFILLIGFCLGTGVAMAQDASSVTPTFQALLSCASAARAPTARNREAMRKVGVSIQGFAMDGNVIIDDTHVDNNDDWAEMRYRFKQPLKIDGYTVHTVWLERQRSGDNGGDNDMKIYAISEGDIGAFAKAHQLIPGTHVLPPHVDMGGHGDTYDSTFKASHFAWTKPLSKLQHRSMSEDVYLPGPARYPPLRFAGTLTAEPGKFAFGCQTFGPDVTSVEGL